MADNILVLRRERGKATATLIGDGRELNGCDHTLSFDGATGAWTLTEPEPDGPKTPERAEILDLLRASAEPMSPKQVADALGKHPSTVRRLMGMMAQSGEVKTVSYGKYLPTATTMNSMNSMNSVPVLNDDKRNHHQQEFTEFTELMGVPASDPDPEADALLAADADDLPPAQADALLAALPDVPPADFLRFAQMVARARRQRLAHPRRLYRRLLRRRVRLRRASVPGVRLRGRRGWGVPVRDLIAERPAAQF